jgi:hypothetical protein
MFINHRNTVCLSGLIQDRSRLEKSACFCKLMCECINAENPHQKCVSDKLTLPTISF